MNSKVLLVLDDAEEEITLVYPNEADALEGKISVLSPIGPQSLDIRRGMLLNGKYLPVSQRLK
jgi:hypothetical protein